MWQIKLELIIFSNTRSASAVFAGILKYAHDLVWNTYTKIEKHKQNKFLIHATVR